MAKESSIAPKERINITFKPATGGVQEEIELPLKMLVIGDFLQRYDERTLINRKPVNVSKNNFADVMAKQNLSIQVAVPNRLVDTDDENDLPVQLEFKDMRSFEPEGVAKQVPEMKKLLELREALISLKGPLGNIPAFRKAIEEVLGDNRQRTMMMQELGLSESDLQKMASAPTPDNTEKTEEKDAPESEE